MILLHEVAGWGLGTRQENLRDNGIQKAFSGTSIANNHLQTIRNVMDFQSIVYIKQMQILLKECKRNATLLKFS